MERKNTTLNRIYAAYGDLYDAEKRVADYVAQHQEKVIEMTVSELAALSAASEATVIRFCKKCGCKGFHQMKILLAKEMLDDGQVRLSGTLGMNDIGQSLANILANKTEELRQTFSHIDAAALRGLLRRILTARTVLLAAMGNTIPAALDGAYKFNQIGIPAVTSAVWEAQLAFARTLQPGDVALAISASDASKYLVALAQLAKERGAVVAAITNHPNSPLARLGDYHITTATRESLFIETISFTRIPALAVLEAMFLLLLTEKRDGCDCVNAHEAIVAEDKI